MTGFSGGLLAGGSGQDDTAGESVVYPSLYLRRGFLKRIPDKERGSRDSYR